MRTRAYWAWVLLAGLLGCCVGSPERRIVTVNGRSFVEPPPDVLLSGVGAEVGARLPVIQTTLEANISVDAKFARVRSELKSVQAFEVLVFRLALACNDGMLSREAFEDFVTHQAERLLASLRTPEAEDVGLPVASEDDAIAALRAFYAPIANRRPPPLRFKQSGPFTETNVVAPNAVLVTGNARVHVTFICGPAGSGKSPTCKGLAGQVIRGGGTAVYIALRGESSAAIDRAARLASLGTLDGLPDVPSLLDPTGPLLSWVSEVVASHYQEHYVGKSLEEGVARELDRAARSAGGLLVAIDGLDEVGLRSNLALMRKLAKFVRSEAFAYGQPTVPIRIMLGCRTEVLHTLRRDVRDLYGLSQESRNGGGASFELLLAEAVPYEPVTAGFDTYVDDCIQWGVDIKLADAEVAAVRNELLRAITGSASVAAVFAYLEGGNYTANYVARRVREGREFDVADFEREVFKKWWWRGNETHGLPPLGSQEAAQYTRVILDVANEVPQTGVNPLTFGQAALRYSGLFVFQPAALFGNEFHIGWQFPFLKEQMEANLKGDE